MPALTGYLTSTDPWKHEQNYNVKKINTASLAGLCQPQFVLCCDLLTAKRMKTLK